MPSQGYLLGKRLSPTEIAGLCWQQGWRDLELVTAGAVTLAESQGYTRAYNDNFRDETGEVLSRDCGLMQISIGAEQIGTPYEESLYDPVTNLQKAWALYVRRGWQPWAAYNNNIALNPAMRGKYLQRASWGVMNFQRKHFGAAAVPSPYIRFGPLRLRRWLGVGAA